MENWAISALYSVLSSDTQVHRHYDLRECRSSLLRRIVEVAILCQHEDLRDLALSKWTERILARQISLPGAMEVADEFGLAKLKGVSYYMTLLECGDRLQWEATSLDGDSDDNEVSVFSDSDTDDTPTLGESPPPSRASSARPPQSPPTLTPSQKARLLSGFFSLTNLWDRVRSTAPVFEKPTGCTYHAHGCLSTWRAIWFNTSRSEETLRYRSADVLGRLRSMEKQLTLDADLGCALTPTCRRAAIESVRRLCQRVEEGLAGHFEDMTR